MARIAAGIVSRRMRTAPGVPGGAPGEPVAGGRESTSAPRSRPRAAPGPPGAPVASMSAGAPGAAGRAGKESGWAMRSATPSLTRGGSPPGQRRASEARATSAWTSAPWWSLSGEKATLTAGAMAVLVPRAPASRTPPPACQAPSHQVTALQWGSSAQWTRGAGPASASRKAAVFDDHIASTRPVSSMRSSGAYQISQGRSPSAEVGRSGVRGSFIV